MQSRSFNLYTSHARTIKDPGKYNPRDVYQHRLIETDRRGLVTTVTHNACLESNEQYFCADVTCAGHNTVAYLHCKCFSVWLIAAHAWARVRPPKPQLLGMCVARSKCYRCTALHASSGVTRMATCTYFPTGSQTTSTRV